MEGLPLPDFQPHAKLFFGLDLAKKHAQLAILTPEGTALANFPFLATQENFLALAHALRPHDALALEVSTSANAVMRLLTQHSPATVTLSNPLFTHSIAHAVVKSDKADARKLADLHRTNYLATVWWPDADTLRLRHFIADRQSLVTRRTALKNQVHSVLQRNLISYECADLCGVAGAQWLDQLLQSDDLDEYEKDRLGFLRREITRQSALVEDLDATLAAFIQSRSALAHQLHLLLSLPGVSLAVGATLLAAIGDVTRFPSKQKLACYFGLTQRIKPARGEAAENRTYF